MDRELSLLNKRHEMCHEEDTMWRRGLTRDGNMPADAEMVMVSNERDMHAPTGQARRPGAGTRSDLLSDRRVAITAQMKKTQLQTPQRKQRGTRDSI